MKSLTREKTNNDPNAVYGIYKGEPKQNKPKLADFFDLYGAWEDDRDADTIIADIYTARQSKPDTTL